MDIEIEIPENWKIVTLDRVAKKITDGSHNPPTSVERGFPMLSARNILNNKIEFSNIRLISEEDFNIENQRTSLEPHDILLTAVGTIGRATLVPQDNSKFVLQRSVSVIKPLINPKYLLYYIQSPTFQKQLIINSSGTAQKGIYINTLKGLSVPLTVIEEQQKIVEKIDEIFSEIDSILFILSELSHKVKLYWYAELQSFLKGEKTKRIIAQPIEDTLSQIQSLRAENNVNYKNDSINSKTINFSIPENWKLVKLSDAFIDPKDSISDGPFGSNLKSSDFKSDGFPVLKIQNIERNEFISKDISHITVEKFNDLEKHQFNSGDIIITKLGSPLGKACIVPKNFPKGVIVADLIRIKQNKFLDSKFLMYSLNSPYIISQIAKLSKGTTRQRVTLNDIRNLTFILPTIEEQETIANKIETLADELKNLNEFIDQSIIEAEALKGKILNDGYTGKLLPYFNNLETEQLEIYLEKLDKEKDIYIQNEKRNKLIPKVKKMKTNLEIEDVLKEQDKPITSFTLWQESRYKDNIEEFYNKLKEIEDKIKEHKEGHLSYIELLK